jgi:epsin
MDLNSLRDTVSNLTLYDLKAGVRKVQNGGRHPPDLSGTCGNADCGEVVAVMNYTEMESKVREATNNEPWGASSTLMQEIANGTFN